MKFLVAYDIANPRRLSRVAARIERQALRVQKSVFIFEGSKLDLRALFSDLYSLIEVHEDCIQAWPVGSISDSRPLSAGVVMPANLLSVVASASQILTVEEP